MSVQPSITNFFGSRKRRADDYYSNLKKVRKLDDGLKSSEPCFSSAKIEQSSDNVDRKQEVTNFSKPPQITPRKKSCDIRSYLTSKSPYRPECSTAITPVKFLQIDGKAKNESTPVKTPGPSNLRKEDRPVSAVKKSIRFEDEVLQEKKEEKPTFSNEVDTDDLIKAANDLVERLKTKNKTLFGLESKEKPVLASREQLRKKMAKSAKLSQLKTSLSRLGKQASEFIQLEKLKEPEVPKLTKFDTLEVKVPKSPHKGALASPVKSPMKPAFERYAHLAQRSTGKLLPLPFCFQRLLDLFISTDTVCSMMANRGELITFKKLKPSVQQLSRKNFTERHLAQIAAVLPSAFTFRQDKVRNFGSTSKGDKYDLVLTPVMGICVDGGSSEKNSFVRALDFKKMTPNALLKRKEAFHAALLNKTMDKHEEFLASLDPPIQLSREELTRWHPNFQLDAVPDVPPASLPEPPNVQKVTSGREFLERAKELLSSNDRMLNALDKVAKTIKTETVTVAQSSSPTFLDKETKDIIDKKVEVHDPLKGISKSLLEKIRAKQAAKALEAMRMTPADEKEFLTLSQLPEIARIVRNLFIDGQKGVFSLESVLERIQFSRKKTSGKGELEALLRRLVENAPEWLTIFMIKTTEYLKCNRATAVAPIIERLEKMAADKKLQISV